LDIAGTAKITARSHGGSNWSPPLRLTLIVAAGLQINEVADKGDPDDRCAGADWVELRNPTPGELPLEGLVLSDDKGPSDADALILGAAGCPLALSAGELLLLCREGAASVGGASFAGCGFAFGIGGEDAVSLHAVDGALVDEVVGCCSGDAGSPATAGPREAEAALRCCRGARPARPTSREVTGVAASSGALSGRVASFAPACEEKKDREEGYFPQDWSSLPAGTSSGGRVGLRLELAWLDRAETPC
jgi:hypothetical protein